MLGGRLGPGHVHGVDLWWDADRVVFGYARQPAWPPAWETGTRQGMDHAFRLRRSQEPTHVFEIRLDGSGLRQLTGDPHWSDFEPTCCANGDVVFVVGPLRPDVRVRRVLSRPHSAQLVSPSRPTGTCGG